MSRPDSAQTSTVLSDGSKVSGWPQHVARAVKIDSEMQTAEREWVAGLRAQGVKAAHPDDGWVDRERNTVHLCYPQFDDGVGVGDRVALGWPRGKTRLVRITDISTRPITLEMRYLHFEEVGGA